MEVGPGEIRNAGVGYFRPAPILLRAPNMSRQALPLLGSKRQEKRHICD